MATQKKLLTDFRRLQLLYIKTICLQDEKGDIKKMAKVIKSFEESTDNVFGDLLTKKRQHKKIKVGLLTCGYFEYWRMYPDSLKEKVEQDLAVVTERLSREIPNIVLSGMVDTLDSADTAGMKFKDEDIDVLIVVEGTYIPDFISLHVINYLKDVPVIFFSTQMKDNVDPNSNYEHSLRNSGIIGLAQLSGTFRKMDKRYRVVVGTINDDRAYAKIKSFVQAKQAIEGIREANIGVIGHVFRGMYDLELSKTFLKAKFNVNVIYIQSSHLMDEWNNVTDEETEQQTQALLSRFKTKDITRDDVFRASRLAIAMKRLAEKFNLDAMSFLDQHYVQRQVLTSARMGASLLMENTDIAVTCEGDLGGLVMMMLMRSISGSAALMGEWGEFDTQSNSCFIIGHGIATPELAVSDDAITLTRTPEEWGFSGAGLNYEFIVKPGDTTIGHFIETANGYKMLISPAKSIPYPTLAYDEIHAMLQVKKPVREYLEEVLESGVTHHCIVGLTNMTAPLKAIAEMLELDVLYIQ